MQPAKYLERPRVTQAKRGIESKRIIIAFNILQRKVIILGKFTINCRTV